MKLGDLTTVRSVKMWLETSNYIQATNSGTSVDELLQDLVTDTSQLLLSELERPWILPKSYINDLYDGSGGPVQFLRNWPVLNVSAVYASGQLITPNVIDPTKPPNQGWRLEDWDGVPPGGPQSLRLTGCRFPMGHLNVVVSYDAGYQTTDEPHTIPVPDTGKNTSFLFVDQVYGIWAQNVTVKYASTGVALVEDDDHPTAAGHYYVVPPDVAATPGSDLSLPGQYEFFEDDANADILITYGYVPSALRRLTTQLVGEAMSERRHIGEISRTIQQQVTAKYRDTDFPAYARPVLQRFRSVLPL